LRKRPKCSMEELDNAKLERLINNYERRQYIIIVNDNITLRNHIVNNPTPKNR